MAKSTNGIQREIKVKGQEPGTIIRFKYLGAVVSEHLKTKFSFNAQATVSLTKLKPVWRDNNIFLGSKVKLTCSVNLYACESWTLTAELEKRMKAFEMKCL